MKLVNYKCFDCGNELEELYSSSEEIPKSISCDCGESMQMFNLKSNSQKWLYNDK